MRVTRDSASRWTDVTLGDTVVGFVYPRTAGGGHPKWGAVVDKDGETGTHLGHADNKTDAVEMVKTAYLKS